MKILGIHSSPNGKRSQTLRLVNAVLRGAAGEGAEIEVVELCKLRIEFCIGCRKCFKTGACVFDDDYASLLEKMLAADGLVWGSPNYSFCVTARMKALIDRMADVIHLQSFDGKYSCAVATGGRDDEVITRYLATNLMDFGAYVSGTAGAVVTRGPEAVDRAEARALELGRVLVNDIRAGTLYFDQRRAMDANRREFQAKIRQAGEAWKHEYDYWESRGWA
ncbi:NAD(P)H-dependent oxidoreductase [Desulfovibrio aminophilus]|uniref:flavodoxin family protein n=1 Tax=Desulfovibrio aminophilus TaxID=81425 RepID=UPI0033915171